MPGDREPAAPANRPKFSLATIGSRPVVICLLLALVTCAAFFPTTRNDFINCDDPLYITTNPQVEGGLTLNSFEWAFRTTCANYWQPLTWLSLMLDVTLFGTGPLGPHLTNLLWHAVNSVLVFLVLRRLTRAHWRSALAAALFALHPLRVESVAWVTERKDVLSGFFFLLTLFAYGRFVMLRQDAGAGRRPATTAGAGHYVAAVLLFALGLMSKPMAVTLPFVLLLLDYWPLGRVKSVNWSELRQPKHRRLWGRLILEKIPFAVIALADSAVTWQINKSGGNTALLAELPFNLRVENVFVSYARYLGKIVWPFDLSVFYPYPHHWPWPHIIFAGALTILLCLAAVRLGRQRPFVFTGWFWFVGMLVPVIGITQAGIQSMADRFTYIPATGIFIIVAWELGEISRRWPAAKSFIGGLALTVLIACGLRTWNQTGHWRNGETLFRYAISVTPDNSFACFNLGCALYENHQVAEATDYFRETVRISPNSPEAYQKLADVLLAQGLVEEAINNYQKTLYLKPRNPSATFNLGNAWLERGEVEKAINYYRTAAEIEPESFDVQNNWGAALERAGRINEAIPHYAEALRLAPTNADFENNLGVALAKSGNLEAAIQHFTAATQMATNNARACCNLGHALAAKGHLDEAIHWYLRAIQINPNFVDAADHLGDAYAEKGQREMAIDCYRKAVQGDPRSISAHLKLARALASAGQSPEAIKAYQAVLQLDPDCTEAKQQLHSLEMDHAE